MKTRSNSRSESGEERRSLAGNQAPAQAKQAAASFMPDARAASLAQLQEQANASTQATQLKACADMMAGQNGAAVQRAEDEDLLQGKFSVAQREEDEELLQAKFAPAQRMEEEDPLQGKFKALQGSAALNALQGRFASTDAPSPAPLQRAEASNKTGLPTPLKAGIESLSGMSMDHVKVHYNSTKPAQLQAHAYAQGSEIHVGAGQERHLAHEAWHVVQQAQGRVRPTMQMNSDIAVNDDASLEQEADHMGARALALDIGSTGDRQSTSQSRSRSTPVTQRMSFYIDKTRYKSEDLNHEQILMRILEIEAISDEKIRSAACLSLKFALEDDINKASKRGGSEYAAARLGLKERLENRGTPKQDEPKATEYGLSATDVEVSAATDDTLFAKGMGLTSFEKAGPIDKGDDHYRKHGKEFKGLDKNGYIGNAKALGRATDSRFIEAKVKNAWIRFDPSTGQIVISNKKLIRTHYVWDKTYTDPVAYAIYYSITSNIGIGLSEVAPEVFAKFLEKGIDLKKMEIEYIKHGAAENKTVEQLADETHRSRADILDVLAKAADQQGAVSSPSASGGSAVKETFTILGTKYDVTDPRIRHDGHCLWDTLQVVYRHEEAALRAAADKVHGVVYGDYVDDVDVWPLLQELGATGLTLHRWQYGNEGEPDFVVEGDGSTVIGMAFDPTGKGHFVPPALGTG